MPTANGTSSEAEAHAVKEKLVLEQFKKSGKFDAMRKQALRTFEQSPDGIAFKARLEQLVDAELQRDTTLAARDRGKAATLIGGAVDRSSCYTDARKQATDHIFTQGGFRGQIEEEIRIIMKKLDDDDAAAKIAATSAAPAIGKEA
jgi:hypothetical protein